MTEEKPEDNAKPTKSNPYLVSDPLLRTNFIAEQKFEQTLDGKLRTEVKKETKKET